MLMSPGPAPDHMITMAKLIVQLGQLPADLQVIPDVDVDLELVPLGQPGWSRRPDLVVVDQVAAEHVRRRVACCAPPRCWSRSSRPIRRANHVIKRSEYANTGIRHLLDTKSELHRLLGRTAQKPRET